MAKNILFAILWMLLLFFIAWPIALFCSWFWIILQVRPTSLRSLLSTMNRVLADSNTLACILLLSYIAF
jgi:hypothetical protein